MSIKKWLLSVLTVFGVVLFFACGSGDEDSGDKKNDDDDTTGVVDTGNGGKTDGSVWKSGIHVGIITFSGKTVDVTDGKPLRLTEKNLDILLDKLENEYVVDNISGTELYYSTHLALATLTKHQSNFPEDTKNVSIVTFTDGNNYGSLDRTLEDTTFSEQELYAKYLKDEIGGRMIDGDTVTAYSIGVLTDLSVNEASMNEGLKSTSSNPEERFKHLLTNFEQVENVFAQIAKELVETTTETSFFMEIVAAGVTNGQKIRMAFDITKNDARNKIAKGENSNIYIEGTINKVPATDISLTDIVYKGLSAGQGPLVMQTIDELTGFQFDGISFDDKRDINNLDTNLLTQWFKKGDADFDYNVEYKHKGDATVKQKNYSAVIYLVLDNSTSMNPSDVDKVRDYAKGFLDVLLKGGNRDNDDEDDDDDNHTHSFGSWTTTKAATCDNTGEEKRTCSICGKTETRTVPKLSGSQCGDDDDSHTHSFGSWTTTKAATCDNTGEEKRTCSICGKTETRTVQKLTGSECGTAPAYIDLLDEYATERWFESNAIPVNGGNIYNYSVETGKLKFSFSIPTLTEGWASAIVPTYFDEGALSKATKIEITYTASSSVNLCLVDSIDVGEGEVHNHFASLPAGTNTKTLNLPNDFAQPEWIINPDWGEEMFRYNLKLSKVHAFRFQIPDYGEEASLANSANVTITSLKVYGMYAD